LFDSINNNLKTINGEKTKEEFKRKIENEFSYLLERIPKEKKEEILEIKKVALQE
jgi:hypothetical protein